MQNEKAVTKTNEVVKPESAENDVKLFDLPKDSSNCVSPASQEKQEGPVLHETQPNVDENIAYVIKGQEDEDEIDGVINSESHLQEQSHKVGQVSNEQSVDGRFEDNRRAVEKMDHPNEGTKHPQRTDFDQP